MSGEQVGPPRPAPRTLAQLCEVVSRYGFTCAVRGDAQLAVSGIATLEEAAADDLSFLSNPKYERLVSATRAGAVVARPGAPTPPSLNVIETADPYAVITVLLVYLYGHRKHRAAAPPLPAQSFIAATACVGKNATIYPGVTIDEHARVGDDAVLYPGCYIGPHCHIGKRALLYPNVTIYEGCILGDRVTLHAGTVIGEDGLGYAPFEGRWIKIPQIGIVQIGDDVELGANCTIDRATLGRTVIGSGTKMSNLVAVGHGTQIGEHCMIVAQTGLAGSVHVGSHVTMAGQVGVVGHIQIGDRATIGAKAGVTNNVEPGETVLGQPAIPIRDMKRQFALMKRLPDMHERLRTLERSLAAALARVEELERRGLTAR